MFMSSHVHVFCSELVDYFVRRISLKHDSTLILLLSVSAAIVIRSYYLRRRQRRLINASIADGTYVPPPSRAHRFGAKPVLHNVHVHPLPRTCAHHLGESSLTRRTWDPHITPVSATLLRVPTDKPPDACAPASSGDPRMHSPGPALRQRRLTRLLPPPPPPPPSLRSASHPPSSPHRFPHRSPSPSPCPSPSPLPSPFSSSPNVRQASAHPQDSAQQVTSDVDVTVLVVMPAPRHSRTHVRGEDEPLPHVEFGVARVPLRGVLDSPRAVSAAVGVGQKAG
ncbi:hypothetical protein WOLCODRAFT_164002 [Wolfiporia cocos MD-104 SS10]|uniref:Uncharacterized protein n=1 Tax=Wolfiporia cocos (strain MD-104) TaxID=742152 RepID=A0A2H3K163_WOLCO|nr:hypothetical protein WOLCODRAFT_164002 [Wolfiporia cocos MD-104 SS10]